MKTITIHRCNVENKLHAEFEIKNDSDCVDCLMQHDTDLFSMHESDYAEYLIDFWSMYINNINDVEVKLQF